MGLLSHVLSKEDGIVREWKVRRKHEFMFIDIVASKGFLPMDYRKSSLMKAVQMKIQDGFQITSIMGEFDTTRRDIMVTMQMLPGTITKGMVSSHIHKESYSFSHGLPVGMSGTRKRSRGSDIPVEVAASKSYRSREDYDETDLEAGFVKLDKASSTEVQVGTSPVSNISLADDAVSGLERLSQKMRKIKRRKAFKKKIQEEKLARECDKVELLIKQMKVADEQEQALKNEPIDMALKSKPVDTAFKNNTVSAALKSMPVDTALGSKPAVTISDLPKTTTEAALLSTPRLSETSVNGVSSFVVPTVTNNETVIRFLGNEDTKADKSEDLKWSGLRVDLAFSSDDEREFNNALARWNEHVNVSDGLSGLGFSVPIKKAPRKGNDAVFSQNSSEDKFMGHADRCTSELSELKLIDNTSVAPTSAVPLVEGEENTLAACFDDLDLESEVASFYDITPELEKQLLDGDSQDSTEALPDLSVEELDFELAKMIAEMKPRIKHTDNKSN